MSVSDRRKIIRVRRGAVSRRYRARKALLAAVYKEPLGMDRGLENRFRIFMESKARRLLGTTAGRVGGFFIGCRQARVLARWGGLARRSQALKVTPRSRGNPRLFKQAGYFFRGGLRLSPSLVRGGNQGLRLLATKKVVRWLGLKPRWPSGWNRRRIYKDPVDYALDSGRFLQYFLYNKYLGCLQGGSSLQLPGNVIVALPRPWEQQQAFQKYLVLLNSKFLDRILAYQERVSSLLSGAALMSNFLYVSGQLLPWYLKYQARQYGWFLYNNRKRRLVRKKKHVYKLKTLFDRLMV